MRDSELSIIFTYLIIMNLFYLFTYWERVGLAHHNCVRISQSGNPPKISTSKHHNTENKNRLASPKLTLQHLKIETRPMSAVPRAKRPVQSWAENLSELLHSLQNVANTSSDFTSGTPEISRHFPSNALQSRHMHTFLMRWPITPVDSIRTASFGTP